MKQFFFLLLAVLLAGCTSQAEMQDTAVSGQDYLAFEILHKTPLSPIKELQKNTAERRKSNNEMMRLNEKIDDCIKEKTKNWRRVIDGKVIRGYDKELDFDMKWDLKEKILNSEKPCRQKPF